MCMRIWNTLFYLINECRRRAAEDNLVSGMIPVAEGKHMQIWVEERQRGDKYEPCFRGYVVNLNDRNKD